MSDDACQLSDPTTAVRVHLQVQQFKQHNCNSSLPSTKGKSRPQSLLYINKCSFRLERRKSAKNMSKQGKTLAVVIGCLSLQASTSFQAGLRLADLSKSSPRSNQVTCFAENQEEASEPGASAGLMSMKSLQTQLASAFSALDETDQYDAVLTGLCAKILDQTSVPEGEAPPSLADPIQLVEEMNARRVRASPRSLMSFIDVSLPR